MKIRRRTRFVLTWLDLLLFGAALALLLIGAILLRVSPVWWGRYLALLDVRVWPTWKGIGVVVIVAESLLVIRYWPNKKCRPPATTERNE
jgi:hypothetical protein